MSDIVIQAEGLGKLYRIGQRVPYLTLRDSLVGAFTKPGRMLRGKQQDRKDTELWALRDASFEVRRGDVVGLIGPNGAGKSTLLKILSRVVKPTTGHAQLRGRMGSLLEVGTGFHPELTGRENTLLNGAILGMGRRDILRRFDEIVAFAEIERFIDTPVKYYSSGMYVRLAFSVAAHLEPEILLVDEVLAVGDVAFQKKCLGRMGDAARQGRTVLFVSHNMAAVALLCNSAIVLEHGRIKTIATTQQAIADYLGSSAPASGSHIESLQGVTRPDLSLHQEIEFISAAFDSIGAKLVAADSDLLLRITVRANQTVDDFSFYLGISSVQGMILGSCSAIQVHALQAGETATYKLTLPNPCLAPGNYYLDLGVGTGNERTGLRQFDVVSQVLHFEVMPPPGDDGTVSQWQKDWGAIRFRRPTTEKCV